MKWLQSRNGERGHVVSVSYFGSGATTEDEAFSQVVNKACEIGRTNGRPYIWVVEAQSSGSDRTVQTQGEQTTYIPVPQPGMPAVPVTTPAQYQRQRRSSALLIAQFVPEETVRLLNIPTYTQVYMDARTCTVIPKN